jgi:hypothetical protein
MCILDFILMIFVLGLLCIWESRPKKTEHKHYILIGLVMHCGDDWTTTAISVPHAAGRANNGQE